MYYYTKWKGKNIQQVLKERNQGYGILVSSVPKDSNAFYSLRDPSEVMEFLKCLVMWKKSSSL